MRGWLALTVLLAGCSPVPPSSDLLAPAAPPSAPTAAGPQGSFDFDGEDRPADDAEDGGEQDPIKLQARLLGLSPDAVSAPKPAPSGDPMVAALAAESAPPAPAMPAPQADPAAAPMMSGSFGVRVLSTLIDVQPPRAVLGLASGREVVVQPGTMLPDDHIVVLAIGRTGVQIATVTGEGYSARVETTTVPALYPVEAAQHP